MGVDPDSGPLQEHYVRSAAEPAHQPQQYVPWRSEDYLKDGVDTHTGSSGLCHQSLSSLDVYGLGPAS